MMLWPKITAVFILAGVHPRGQGLQGPAQHVVDAIRGRPAADSLSFSIVNRMRESSVDLSTATDPQVMTKILLWP